MCSLIRIEQCIKRVITTINISVGGTKTNNSEEGNVSARGKIKEGGCGDGYFPTIRLF